MLWILTNISIKTSLNTIQVVISYSCRNLGRLAKLPLLTCLDFISVFAIRISSFANLVGIINVWKYRFGWRHIVWAKYHLELYPCPLCWTHISSQASSLTFSCLKCNSVQKTNSFSHSFSHNDVNWYLSLIDHQHFFLCFTFGIISAFSQFERPAGVEAPLTHNTKLLFRICDTGYFSVPYSLSLSGFPNNRTIISLSCDNKKSVNYLFITFCSRTIVW